MKTLKILVLFIAAVAILSACGTDDEKAKPTIKFSGENTPKELDFTNQESINVVFDVVINAEAKIKTFEVKDYVIKGDNEDFTSVNLDDEKFSNEAEYTYTYRKTFTESDFEGGVTKIEARFSVVDKDNNGTNATFVFTKKAAEEPPVETPLSAWSSEITLGMKGQSAHDVTTGQEYGFEYTTQTGTELQLTSYNGAKFVIISSDAIDTQEALAEAYNNGTEVDKVMVPFTYTESKEYEQRIFISKVGDNYYLIKTTDAKVATVSGNHVKFQEKH